MIVILFFCNFALETRITMAENTSFKKDVLIGELTKAWQPMSKEQIALLVDNITVHKFKKNEMVYKEQDNPTTIFYLAKGKLKIHKEGDTRRNQIIRIIKPGEFFGYRAYFAGEDYSTAAIALESSVCVFIPVNVVSQLMKENYKVSLSIIKQLSKELGIANDRTISFTQKHIRGRLAEALLSLKDVYGVEEDGHTLSIYLSREDLANMSNMTTSNAIRTLSTFANEKLIAIDGRKIKLIQSDKLQEVSKYE